MTLIVKTVTRLVAAFITIFGVYTVLYGHVSPGGGFVGGVVLASGLVLVVLAFGREYASTIATERAAGLWDSVGALAFLGVALLGYLAWRSGEGVFFSNFIHYKGEPGSLLSGGAIALSNMAIGLKVGACIFGVFLVLVGFKAAARREEKA
jgi:multicomponent Na+:H+ antiporter subunit B